MKKDVFMREIEGVSKEKLNFMAKVEPDFDFNNPEKYTAIIKCTDHAGLTWELELITKASSFEIKLNEDQEPTMENIYKELWEQACNVIETNNKLMGAFYTL